MRIGGIQKTSTVDFPGMLSAVVFTAGCNFNCFYCHNRRLLSADAELLDYGEILSFLEKRAGMLDGVVISGGEPTTQPDLYDFAARVKGLGYRVKLDTNGGSPKAVERLLLGGMVDYVALDYKAPFEEYEAMCGQSGEGVRRTTELLFSFSAAWEMRTTLVPQISGEKLRRMAAALPALPSYVLQLYRPQPGDTRYLKTLLPYAPSELEKMAEGIKDLQPSVRVRG